MPVRLSYHPGYGRVTVDALRPVVLGDWSGDVGNPKGLANKLYLENVSNVGADPQFCPAGQQTWARSLNDEQGSGATGDVVVNGGTLVGTNAASLASKSCMSGLVSDTPSRPDSCVTRCCSRDASRWSVREM